MTLEEYLNEHGSDYCTEPLPGFEEEAEDDLLDDEDCAEEDEDA